MINGRAKGAGGEREAAIWLQEKFNLAELPQRNLEQVRSGGFDLIGFEPFAFEIKRSEAVDKRAWWNQVKKCTDSRHIPVVMYRKNRQPWRFLIDAEVLGIHYGFVQLEAREFILWGKTLLKNISI